MNDLAFERELRSSLHALVPKDVPVSLSNTLAALPDGRRSRLMDAVAARLWPGTGSHRLAAAAMSLLAVAVVGVLGAVMVWGYGLQMPGSSGAGSGPRQFDWHTQVASLEADSVTIAAGGRTFRVPADAQVHSDPGDATYQTLELDWSEQGIEQRLYMYFAADNANWWISEIRTYNGAQAAEWIYYDAPQVATPRGTSYVSSLDLSGTGNGIGVTGELRIADMRLTAFAPGTGVVFQPGCQPAEPAATPGDQPAPPRPLNPDLSRYGIQLGMVASLADSRLTAAGICHDFRYEYAASGYAQVWCAAPAGNVSSWLFGSSGEVILFVQASPAEMLAPDASLLVGCSGAPGDVHGTSQPGP
jgi:hypothetical protein